MLRQIPSIRLSLRAIMSSKPPQQDPPIHSRQEIEQELIHCSKKKHKQASLSPHRISPKLQPLEQLTSLCKQEARKRLQLQVPPNDYATFKKQHLNKTLWTQNQSADLVDGDSKNLGSMPFKNRCPLSGLIAQDRITLHSPKNGLFTNPDLSAIDTDPQAADKSRAQNLFCELMDRLLLQNQPTPALLTSSTPTPTRVNSQPLSPAPKTRPRVIKKENKENMVVKPQKTLFQKSAEQLQLQNNILELNRALKLKQR